jgi:hypothetical protein
MVNYKVRDITCNINTEMTTTEVVKHARFRLKGYHDIGIDKEVKSVDFNKSINAIVYLNNIGVLVVEVLNEKFKCKICGKTKNISQHYDNGKSIKEPVCSKCMSDAKCDYYERQSNLREEYKKMNEE